MRSVAATAPKSLLYNQQKNTSLINYPLEDKGNGAPSAIEPEEADLVNS